MMEQIRSYFQSENHSCHHRIDDQTAEDLHLDDVFSMLDHTKSVVGRQYLYKSIRCIPNKSEFIDFEDRIKTYQENTALQSGLTNELKKLEHRDAYKIYSLISEQYIPYKKKTIILFRVLQLLPSLFLGLFLLTNAGVFIVALAVSALINLVIHYRSKSISFFYSESIPQLYRLIHIAHHLSKRKIPLNV